MVKQRASNPQALAQAPRGFLRRSAAATAAPAAGAARPLSRAPARASDGAVSPDYPAKPPPPRARPSKLASQLCGGHDFQLLSFAPFKWKLAPRQRSPPREKQQGDSDSESALPLPSKPITLALFLDDSFSRLRRGAPGRLPALLTPRLAAPSLQGEDEGDAAPTASSSSCSPPERSTRKDPPVTASLLPRARAADKRRRRGSSESRLRARAPPARWSATCDPTSGQVQARENNRARARERQRKSRRFACRRGKRESALPRSAKIAAGRWRSSYFALLSAAPRPLVTRRQARPDSFLAPPGLAKPLPALLQPPPSRAPCRRPSPACRRESRARSASSKARARPRPARGRPRVEASPASSHCKRAPSLDARQPATRKKREPAELLRARALTRRRAPRPALRLARRRLGARLFPLLKRCWSRARALGDSSAPSRPRSSGAGRGEAGGGAAARRPPPLTTLLFVIFPLSDRHVSSSSTRFVVFAPWRHHKDHKASTTALVSHSD